MHSIPMHLHLPVYHDVMAATQITVGINIARKGWLEAKDIANTMDAENMAEYLKAKRQR